MVGEDYSHFGTIAFSYTYCNDSRDALVSGAGPFAALGEEVYDDYWMFYLTRHMAEAVGVKRP